MTVLLVSYVTGITVLFIQPSPDENCFYFFLVWVSKGYIRNPENNSNKSDNPIKFNQWFARNSTFPFTERVQKVLESLASEENSIALIRFV